MSDWFEKLHGNRLTWLKSTRQNNLEQGIKNLTVDKYTEPVHFIYELLQNAEDQGATSVHFILTNNDLEFCHNGRSFQQKDVENITGIGNTQKASQGDKIGCFGIGFKSVFEITDRPEIYALLDGKPFAFAIEDQFVPIRLPVKEEYFKEDQTRFVLPFQSGTERFYNQIRDKLRVLGADTLLFLDHLTAIHWKTDTEEGVYRCKRSQPPNEWCDLISEERASNESAICQETRYLRFSKASPVIGSNSELAVRIAFRVEDKCIEPEKDLSVLNVFFPTGEKTGLKFRLHAPMLLNDSRTSIKKENETNSQLMQDCATLLAESLSHLKEVGLLNVECLNCLPIREEDFPIGSTFRPLYDAVRTALRTQHLLPTKAGSSQSHTCASSARLSETSRVRTLLNEELLTDLYNYPPANTLYWLSEKITDKLTKDLWVYLKKELHVDEIDAEDFAAMLNGSFLERQHDTWIVQFYQNMSEIPSLWAKTGRLRKKEIIRLEDGSHVLPFTSDDKPNAFLPSRIDGGLPIIKRSVVQDEKALAFLKSLGFTQPDIMDIVLTKILPELSQIKRIDRQTYFSELPSIADAIDNGRSDRRSDLESALKKTAFLPGYIPALQTYSLRRPMDIYQNTPELCHWFAECQEVYLIPDWLVQEEAWRTILGFVNRTTPTIRDTVRVSSSDESAATGKVPSKKSNYKRGLNGFDPSAKIAGLEQALEHITLGKAQTLWRILLDNVHLLTGLVQRSKYQNYRDEVTEKEASDIYNLCNRHPWLPDNSGNFHLPSNISLFDLSKTFDSHSEKAKQLADGLNMKRVDALEKEREAEKFAKYKRLEYEFDAFLAQKREKVALPAAGNDITSTRAEKVRQAQLDSPDVKYETLPRSVRTSSSKLRDQDRQYLMDYCTNVDGQVVCQICESKMPFKVNGYDYFEAVQFWRGGKKEIIYNRMALCPVCAAKWLYANNHTPEELRAKLLACQPGENLTITLAGEPANLTFFGNHLGRLKALLQDVERT